MFKKLFKRKIIKVRLIEVISNEAFGTVKMKPEQLPSSFEKPTTIHIEGGDWQVEKAEPIHADEFINKGELTLWLNKIIKIDPQNIRYSIPTITNELPSLSDKYSFYDLTHTIHEDDWRQMEFLPQNELPVIEEEMKMIEDIIFPEDDPDFDSTVNGFDRVHIRKIGRRLLNIPLDDFISTISIEKKGNLAIDGHIGFIENGFAFKSANHIYYGTLENGIIKELCLDFYDSMDDEISSIISKYNLLLVLWCRGSITSV